MSSKQHAIPNRRLYPKRSNITPAEKRANPNAQNLKNKTANRNANKDQKNQLTKQDLIKKYIDLQRELQDLQEQLNIAKTDNENLKAKLNNLKKSGGKNNTEEEEEFSYTNQNYDDNYNVNLEYFEEEEEEESY